MVSLDISDNSLGAEGAKILAEALKAQQQLVCDDGKLFKSKGVLARSTCKHCGKKKDVHATRGALVKFNISNNTLRAEGAKALGEALKGNKVLQELNIAGNELIYKADAKSKADTDMAGVIAIGDAIPTMGALASLDLSQNYVPESEMEQIKTLCQSKEISLKI